MSFRSTDKGRILIATETLEQNGTDQVQPLLQDPTKEIIYQAVRARNVVAPERTTIAPPRIKGGIAGTAHQTVPNQSVITAEIAFTGLPEGKDRPDWDAWMLAAGMGSYDYESGVEYRPRQYSSEALTVYEFADNLEDSKAALKTATGVRGGFSLSAQIEDEIVLTFNGLGQYNHPREAAQYYDAYGSLTKLKDGTTNFGSHTQKITVVTAVDGYEYVVKVDEQSFTYEAGALDTAADIATELASLINASALVDCDADATTNVVTLTGTVVGDRFHARLRRREGNMTIESNERYANLATGIVASGMTITMGDTQIKCSGFTLTPNNAAEGVRTITGASGLQTALSIWSSERVILNLDILDGNPVVYNQILEYWESGEEITLDILGSDAGTDFHLKVDNAQIFLPEETESGSYVGWSVQFALNGQWDDVSGGSDFTIRLTPKA